MCRLGLKLRVGEFRTVNADNCPDFSLSKIEAREFVGNDDAVEIGRSRCQDGMTQKRGHYRVER